MIVFSFTCYFYYKTMINWWDWPNYIILVFFLSPSNNSWSTSGSCPTHSNPQSPRQDYISYYPSSLYSLLNLSKIINYQSWISLPRSNRSSILHPQLPRVHDCNIQSCRVLWNHPWLCYSWKTDNSSLGIRKFIKQL